MKYEAKPIIEKFTILGLNGYKNIEINTSTLAKIISAENGTGKTTILNALCGVLSGKHKYLSAIDFQSISIKFFNKAEICAERGEILSHIDIKLSSLDNSQKSSFLSYEINEDELSELLEQYISDPDGIESNDIYQRFYLNSPYTKDDIEEKLKDLTDIIDYHKATSSSFRAQVQEAMEGYKVLYFPTYRRIETEIAEFRSRLPRRRPGWRRQKSNSWDSDKLINFGLSDIEARLEELTNDITRGTYEAYARISGRTLDQLVSVRNNSLGPVST